MRVPSSPKRLRKHGVLFLPLSISQQLPLHCAKAPITVECGDDMLDPGRQTFCSRVAFWRQRHLAAWKHISWLSCQESGEEGRRICWIPPFLFMGYLFNSNSNSFQFQEQPARSIMFRKGQRSMAQVGLAASGEERRFYIIAALQIQTLLHPTLYLLWWEGETLSRS